MAKGFTDVMVEQLLDNMLGDSVNTPLAQASVWVGLSTTDPGVDGTGFTEPVGGAYARQEVLNDATRWPGSASREKSNGETIVYPTATGGWGTIVAWGIFTADTGGNPVLWGELDTARPVLAGDRFEHGVGKLIVTLNNQS